MAKRREKIPVKSKNRKDNREGLVEQNQYVPLDEFDRLLNQFRSNFNDLLYGSSFKSPLTTWEGENQQPFADVIDHGDRFEMNVELPGISKEDITVEVTPYNIEISAQKSEETEEEGKTWLRRERNYSYYRSFEFPDEIKPDEVNAEMKEGVLTIDMPKQKPTPHIKSKKVKVK